LLWFIHSWFDKLTTNGGLIQRFPKTRITHTALPVPIKQDFQVALRTFAALPQEFFLQHPFN
jgi:hypothetical protein